MDSVEKFEKDISSIGTSEENHGCSSITQTENGL